MQSNAVARHVVSCLLSRPCCCREALWSRSDLLPQCGALQNVWPSQRFSTAETGSASSAADSSASTSASDQPQRSEAKDTARLAHAEAMRKLRRKWQSQHAQRLAVKAEAEAKKSANKAASEEAHRAKKAQMKELRVQIHEEKRRLQAAELVSLACCCIVQFFHLKLYCVCLMQHVFKIKCESLLTSLSLSPCDACLTLQIALS